MRLADYKKATTLLKSAPETLHLQAEYHYMLARCAARAEQFNEAKQALQRCFSLDKYYRQRALDEPDFESIW